MWFLRRLLSELSDATKLGLLVKARMGRSSLQLDTLIKPAGALGKEIEIKIKRSIKKRA